MEVHNHLLVVTHTVVLQPTFMRDLHVREEVEIVENKETLLQQSLRTLRNLIQVVYLLLNFWSSDVN